MFGLLQTALDELWGWPEALVLVDVREPLAETMSPPVPDAVLIRDALRWVSSLGREKWGVARSQGDLVQLCV